MGDRFRHSSVSVSRIGGGDAAVMRPAVLYLRPAVALRAAAGRRHQARTC
jgi:hypothetical protein